MSSMNLAPCHRGCEPPKRQEVCCSPRHRNGLKPAPAAQKAGKTNLRNERLTKRSQQFHEVGAHTVPFTDEKPEVSRVVLSQVTV